MKNNISRRTALGGTLAAALAAGTAVSTAAPAAAATFADVPSSHIFYREITALARAGVIGGWPDGTFRPDAPVRRDAMAAFLYRLVGEPTVDLSMGGLGDVPPGIAHREAMFWAWQQGVIFGIPGNRTWLFEPRKVMTRIQGLLAVYYTESLVLKVERGQYGMAAPAFDDMPLSEYPAHTRYADAATWGRTRNITQGWEQGTRRIFRPEEPLLRDATAAFVHRLGVNSVDWSENYRIPLPRGFVRL
mgnify:CR=1 FL=1